MGMSPLLNLSPALLQAYFVGAVPHHCQIGMQAAGCWLGGVRLDLPWSAALANAPDSGLHPGLLTTLIDAASGSAVLTQMDDFRRSATLDLRVDFLRPTEAGATVQCEAEVVQMNGHVAFTRAIAHHGDARHPVAVSSGSFAVFKGRTGSPLSELDAPLPDFPPHVAAAGNPDASPLQQAFDAVPYARMMGFEALETADGVMGHFAFGDHLVGNPVLRALHGGGIGSLLKFTAAAQLMTQLGSLHSPALFNINLEYLRLAQPVATFARATVVSCTRRFANLRVSAYQDDPLQPISVATAQFLLA